MNGLGLDGVGLEFIRGRFVDSFLTLFIRDEVNCIAFRLVI